MKIVMLLLLVTSAAAGQSDPNAERDAKMIGEVKQLSVQKLDGKLPNVALAKWMEKELPDARYHWEVNDCGEQTGDPNSNGPVPTCVEVDASLKDGREIVVFVADDQAGKTAPPDWEIFFAQLTTPHEKINLRHLSDIPAALTRTH